MTAEAFSHKFFLNESAVLSKVIREPTPFVHANDRFFAQQVIDQSSDLPKSTLGLVIGNGYLLSLLPYIPVHRTIVVDRNEFVLEWLMYTCKAVLDTSSPQQYISKVYSNENPLYVELKQSRENPIVWFEREKKEVGPFHFAYNQANFDKVKANMITKEIAPIQMDLTDTVSVALLADQIRGTDGVISWANFTNVHEFINSGSLPLNRLPFCDTATIYGSSMAWSEDIFPVARKFASIREYSEAAKLHLV